MNVTGIIVLIVLIALALVAVGVIAAAKRRTNSQALRGRFGPEYDRAVDELGGRKAAESHLSDVAGRRDSLTIRELEPQLRERFVQRWSNVQAAFVDQPAGAVRDADLLVAEVMNQRGYPVDDTGTKADMIAVDHPQIAHHYRVAHAVGAQADRASTEDQRQAFVHYRALFAELLEDGVHGRHADGQNGHAPPSPR